MTFDAGRIRHDAVLMHYSRMSNGTSAPSNWRLSATGDTGMAWTPESTTAVSYGSNSNDVSTSSVPGASTLVARTDHTHRGVRSVSVSSNTLVGDTTLLGEGSVGITVAGQTIKINVAPVAAGGGSVSYGSNSNDVGTAGAAGASTLVSRTDHVHRGVSSLSHTSNTFYGPVILTASGSTGITSPTPGTFNISSTAGAGGGGGGTPAASASYIRTAGNYTTTSTTFVDVDATNLALTITTGARKVLIGFAGVATNGNGDGVVYLDVAVDGTRLGTGSTGGLTGTQKITAGAYRLNGSFTVLTAALSAASHTFKLQWRVDVGTGTIYGSSSDIGMQFWVVEQST